MTRKFRAIAIVAACGFLIACSLKAKWRDITDQKRSDAQSAADYGICAKDAGLMMPDGSMIAGATNDDLNDMVAKMKTCMHGRGWELVRTDD